MSLHVINAFMFVSKAKPFETVKFFKWTEG